MTSAIDDGAPVQWKKYDSYKLNVDPNQDDKAIEILLCDISRPHMRAFHICWWSFFMAFIIWFAISPIQSEIKTTLNLSKQELWTASIVGVGGTIFVRILIGPLCDKFGARLLMGCVLMAASFPTACCGLVNSARDLAIVRLFIGIAGSSFVMCQYWMTNMFAKQIVGTANGIAGGWGNLGGGVTQLFVGSALFPMFRNLYDGDKEKAWRTVCIIPAILAFISGILCIVLTDDAPKGNYQELKKSGIMKEVSAAKSFRAGVFNVNTWILFIQYGTCFGVELTMHNAAPLYFKEEFGLSTEGAAAIAGLFAWMNLFARGVGGYISDYFNAGMGMKGRILVQTIYLLGEGTMILCFVSTKQLGTAIFCGTIFSVFAFMGCGGTYGIVPYVDPPATGTISGIVGAGGNVGAVSFGLCFRQLEYKTAFMIMGWVVLASALLSYFVIIEGQNGLIWGEERVLAETLQVPDKKIVDDDESDELNEA